MGGGERGCRLHDEEGDAMSMTEIDVNGYANELFQAHGIKAVAEAAKRAGDFEAQGNAAEAETWRRIEKALKLIRGPNQS
jgi:hypothetical protein